MKTYSTYQEAKIANQGADIFVSNVGKFHAVKESPTSHFANGWKLCKPEDYCVTAKSFLANGNRFVDGDIYANKHGEVCYLNSGFAHLANQYHVDNDNVYILRAAALKTEHQQEMEELKPKRTRVEYVKVDWKSFCDEKFINLCDYVVKINGRDYLVSTLNFEIIEKNSDEIYRKVEVEIDERQEFIDFTSQYIKSLNPETLKSFECIARAMFDSGEFKLVDGE